ncbi:Signal peptidase complex subunit 3 [Frankliniella fusca]|uniref:Signal peptidase complex subunit 3 n=1 Tax=Frankliniella fusca TaxID=407009 RepID=A0AAE1LDS1_9NEOP|nr:Signal peptidase complex subunit 3 [Frankliniella fusca]
MHSVFGRGNAMAAYTLSVLAGLTFCCFLSTVFLDYRTPATINTRQVVVKSIPDYSASREKNDLGYQSVLLLFSLIFVAILNCCTHLTHLFNWNVKQLFLYVTAEYQTPSNEFNQVVLWDKIILRGENAVIDLKNIHAKYYFWDDGNGLKGHKNVTLTLSWNIIPNAGLLPNVGAIGSHSFSFPPEYTTSRV